MKIILCRHGQTAHNVGNLCSGHSDIGLSDYGVRQAHALGVALQQHGVTKLFCSDLRRAVETASIIATYIKCQPTTSKELRERCFGVFEGRPGAELRADLAIKKLTPEMYRPEGGENYYDVIERARTFLEILRLEPLQQTIAIVAHGNFNCALLSVWKGVSPCDVRQDSACLNVIDDPLGSSATVSLLNSVEHLSGLMENVTK